MSKKITVKDGGGNIIAEGDFGSTVLLIEGNYYFDKSGVDFSRVKMKDEGGQYTCPIKKGTCDYYNIVDDSGNIIVDEAGWIYESVDNAMFDMIVGKMALYGNKVDIEKE